MTSHSLPAGMVKNAGTSSGGVAKSGMRSSVGGRKPSPGGVGRKRTGGALGVVAGVANGGAEEAAALKRAKQLEEFRARVLARVDGRLVFEVADDPRFERDGEDLYTEVLATYPQLVLGGTIEVPTVDATMTLEIPPGTQSGQVFHLRGRGLARVNASGTGDLHVRVQLWTPEDVSPEERAVLQQLHTLRPRVELSSRGKGFWSRMKEALGA